MSKRRRKRPRSAAQPEPRARGARPKPEPPADPAAPEPPADTATAPPGGIGRRALRSPLLLVALAAVLACIPIWLPRYLASMDGPQHLLAAHMAVHFEQADWGFSRYFTANPSDISPILGDRILRALMLSGLGPPLAQKVLLTVWVVAMAAAVAYAASWRRRDGATLAVAGLLTVPGLALGMGFFEYLLSLPLAIAALGVVLRGPGLEWRRLALLAALALGSALAHPFTLVALLPALGVAAWASRGHASLPATRRRGPNPDARPRRLRRIAPHLGGIALSLLPALGVAGIAFLSHVGAPTPVTQPTVWAPFGESLRTLALDGFGGLAPTGLLGLAGVGAVLLGGGVGAWREGGWASRGLLLAAALYGLLTLATPSSALNWALLHHRFVPLAWLVAVVAVGGSATQSRLGPVALAVAGLGLLGQSVVSSRVNLQFDRGLREYASAATFVPRASRLLPLNFDPRGESDHRLIRPYLHAWAYVLMERGGMTPYVFATLPSHAFHFQDRPKAPAEFLDQGYSCERAGLGTGTAACLDYHRRRLEAYARQAEAFDAVLTRNAPDELRPLLEARGFELRHRSEHLAVYGKATQPDGT